jgi:hypothetical protein
MFFVSLLLISCSANENSGGTTDPSSLVFSSSVRFSNDNVTYFDDVGLLNLNEVIYIDLEVDVRKKFLSELDSSTITAGLAAVNIFILSGIIGLATSQIVLDKPINDFLSNDFDLFLEVNNSKFNDNIFVTRGTLRKDEIFDTKGSFGFLDEIISGRKKNYILMINYPYIKNQSPKEILDFDLDLFQDGSKLAEFNYKIDFE